MLTSLDYLVIVFMGLAALTLLSLALMFLLKNEKAKRVCFYIVSLLGLYVSTIGLRIGFGGWFVIQMGIGVLTVLAGIAAIVLDVVARDNTKMRRVARIVSAITLVIAMMNAIL